MKTLINPDDHLPDRLKGNIQFPRMARYRTIGNFTVVLIFWKEDGFPAIGIAKRSTRDKNDAFIGVRIALARAVKDLLKGE
jgi:hypothetical protein